MSTRKINSALGIDTSGGNTIISLRYADSGGGESIHTLHDTADRDRLNRVAPLIHAVTSERNVSIADIDLFIVSNGPGSFVGLRIGLAACKGLAAGTGKPFVTVGTFAPYYYLKNKPDGCCIAVIAATKSRYFAKVIDGGIDDFDAAGGINDCDAGELAQLIQKQKSNGGVHILAHDDILAGQVTAALAGELTEKIPVRAINPQEYGEGLVAGGIAAFHHSGGAAADVGSIYVRKISAELDIDTNR